MAEIIKEAAHASRKPADSETRVKHLKNEQIITLKEKIRERLRKREMSSKSVDVLDTAVTHWQAVHKSRFAKYN